MRRSWPKVEAFAQQVTDACLERFAVDEDMLVGLASELSVEDTVRMLRHWASQADPELDDDDEDRRQDQRSAYLSETWLGMGDLAGNLSPECLLLLGTQLDLIMEELYRDEARGDVAERTTAQRRHDALLELAHRAAAWDAQNTKTAHPSLLVLLTEQWLAAQGHHVEDDGEDATEPADQSDERAEADQGEGDGRDQSDEDDPDTVEDATPRPVEHGMGPKAKATPLRGPAITNETARRLACDAEIARLVVGADGEVLDHGRAKRLFTAAQRRAILTRYDNTCPWGDCDRPAGWLEMHHIEEWDADHGPTDLANGIPPCRTHHRCLHEGGFTVTRATNGDLTFHRPDGTPITTNPNTALWQGR